MKKLNESEKDEIRNKYGTRKQKDRIVCPACVAGRKDKKSKPMSLTVTGEMIMYCCHHCNVAGGFPIEKKEKREGNFRVSKVDSDRRAIVKNGIEYLNKRRISEETARIHGLTSVSAWFYKIERKAEAIAFPYFRKDKRYDSKIKCIEEKDFVVSGALDTLFASQLVDLKEENYIIICEGELDALSYFESGVMNATSVPNGTSSLTYDHDDKHNEKKIGFLWNSKDLIDDAERVYVSVDNDDPGQKLSEELARRIGKEKCWKVEYPEGCKDANDVLMKHSASELAKCFDNAIPWPVEGLYEAEYFEGKVDELYDKGFGKKVSTGFNGVDDIYSVGPGLLTVVTGIPSHGKTTFINQIMVNLSNNDPSYIHAVCSFETPPQVHIMQLTEMLTQKTFFEQDYGNRVTLEELQMCKKFINTHFKFFYQEAGQKATISSVIERLKIAVFRWGVRSIVIDPYNYIERPKKMDSETSWIDDMLTDLRLFAQAHDVHIWFVAHPTKIQMNADGTYPPPKGYSISGSSSWYSKPDFGLTIHTDKEKGETRVINWKTRFNWLGRDGESTIYYDLASRVYRERVDDGIYPISTDFYEEEYKKYGD